MGKIKNICKKIGYKNGGIDPPKSGYNTCMKNITAASNITTNSVFGESNF